MGVTWVAAGFGVPELTAAGLRASGPRDVKPLEESRAGPGLAAHWRGLVS